MTFLHIFLLFQAGPAYCRSASWGLCGVSIHWKHLLPLLPTPLDTQYHGVLQEGFPDSRVWSIPLGSHSFWPSRTAQSTSACLVQYLNIVSSGRQAGAATFLYLQLWVSQ